MARFPADSESRRIDTRACAIVHYKIDCNHWDYKLENGHDIGCDCILELSEDNYWKNHRIRLQIKGTKSIDNFLVNNGAEVSFSLAVAVINYALASPEPFLLVVVDVVSESIYYRELHDHFLEHGELRAKLEKQKTVNVRFPGNPVSLPENDEELCLMARRRFTPDDDGWFREV